METLMNVAQHRHHYYYAGSKGKPGFDSGSGFREINRRTFETGSGLLPSPVLNRANYGRKSSKDDEDSNPSKKQLARTNNDTTFKSNESSVLNRALSSLKPQTLCGNYGRKSKDEDVNRSKKVGSSSCCSRSIPISLKDGGKRRKPTRGNDNLSLSELWAGPAYSNSPMPSSLPIPKFSLKAKRSVSFELPVIESDLNLQPMAKSAPASPTREVVWPSVRFLRNDECATKTLCRILNLDIADD